MQFFKKHSVFFLPILPQWNNVCAVNELCDDNDTMCVLSKDTTVLLEFQCNQRVALQILPVNLWFFFAERKSCDCANTFKFLNFFYFAPWFSECLYHIFSQRSFISKILKTPFIFLKIVLSTFRKMTWIWKYNRGDLQGTVRNYELKTMKSIFYATQHIALFPPQSKGNQTIPTPVLSVVHLPAPKFIPLMFPTLCYSWHSPKALFLLSLFRQAQACFQKLCSCDYPNAPSLFEYPPFCSSGFPRGGVRVGV